VSACGLSKQDNDSSTCERRIRSDAGAGGKLVRVEDLVAVRSPECHGWVKRDRERGTEEPRGELNDAATLSECRIHCALDLDLIGESIAYVVGLGLHLVWSIGCCDQE